MTFTDPPAPGRRSHWDENVSVPVAVAARIVGRTPAAIRKWRDRGLAVETLGGIEHVNVGDLLDWRDEHGRRRGRKRDY